MKRRKQKPDLRRICVSQSYTVQEAATLLNRQAPTIRQWIRQGLPILQGTSPRLIHGSDLKAWLGARWKARKHPCGIAQLYCCKCRRPRRPKPDSVATKPLSTKTVTVSGKCGACGTAMQQPRSLNNLAETIAAMKTLTQDQAHLSGYTKPPVQPTLWPHDDEPDLNNQNKGKPYVH